MVNVTIVISTLDGGKEPESKAMELDEVQKKLIEMYTVKK